METSRATAFTIGLIRDSASRLRQFSSNLLDAVDTIVDDHPAHDCTECQLTWRVAQLERELLSRETVAAAVQKLGGRVEWDVCPKETIARIDALIDDDEYEQAATELAKAKETAPTDPELVRLQTMIDFMTADWRIGDDNE